MNALEKALGFIEPKRRKPATKQNRKSALSIAIDQSVGITIGRKGNVQQQANISASADAWDILYAEWEQSQIIYEGNEREARDTLKKAAKQVDAIVGVEDDYSATNLMDIASCGPDDAIKRGAIRTFLERMIQAWIEFHHNEGAEAAELLASHHILPSLTALSWTAQQLR